MLWQIHLSPVILIFLNLSLLHFSHSPMVCKYYFPWKNKTRQKFPSLLPWFTVFFFWHFYHIYIYIFFFKGFFIYLILHPYFAVISGISLLWNGQIWPKLVKVSSWMACMCPDNERVWHRQRKKCDFLELKLLPCPKQSFLLSWWAALAHLCPCPHDRQLSLSFTP